MTATTIRDGLDLLATRACAVGGIVEVALLRTSKATVRGYFTSPDGVDTALSGLDATALRPEGVYITLGAVRRDLLARCNHRFEPFAKTRVADVDMTRRLWLPVDCDPVRPSGISATDTELQASIARANDVVAWLRTEHGWPEPVRASGGNSGHALYAIDLPNEEATTALVKGVLTTLAQRFTDEAVNVDASVFNAARVWTLYGTVKRKGDSTPERPHRRSFITSRPDPLVCVSLAQLEAVARLAPVNGHRHSTTTRMPDDGILDMAAEFTSRGWYLRDLGAGKHAVTCPWASAHSGESGLSETALFEPRDAGAVWGFKCQHAHCADRTIGDVWTLVQPARPPDPVIIDDRPQTREPAYAKPPVETGAGQCVLRPLLHRPYSGMFARGAVHLVAGSSGAGKSTLMLDLLQTQRHGGRYLGHVGAQLDYLVLFADRGAVSNTETLQRMRIDPQTMPIDYLPPTANGEEALRAILAAVERPPDLPAVVFVEGADLLVEDASKTHVVTPFMVGLRHMAEHYRLAVVLSVGSPKSRPHEAYALKRDQVFGSQAWSRLADTVLVLTIMGDGTTATRDLVVLHRNAGAETFHLAFVDGLLVEAETSQATEPNMLEWMRDTEVFTKQKFREAFSLSGGRATTLLDGYVAIGVLREKVKQDRTVYVFNRLAASKAGLVPPKPVSVSDAFSDTISEAEPEPESVRKMTGHGHDFGESAREITKDVATKSDHSLVPPKTLSVVRDDSSLQHTTDNGHGFRGYTRAREDDDENGEAEAGPGPGVSPRRGERGETF